MNEKAVFEIRLTRCEHVTYLKVRTISMITISMITNQNWVNKRLLHYYIKLSQTWYINWKTWRTECGTIYKNIGKMEKNEQKM